MCSNAHRFNCTKFFELEIVRNPACRNGDWKAYQLGMGTIGMNETYKTVFVLWISSIVMIFLPFLTLLIGNSSLKSAPIEENFKRNAKCKNITIGVLNEKSLIAVTIRKSMQRLKWAERISRHSELKEKSRDATRVLIVIVFIFLICNFWSFVMALVERIVPDSTLHTKYR